MHRIDCGYLLVIDYTCSCIRFSPCARHEAFPIYSVYATLRQLSESKIRILLRRLSKLWLLLLHQIFVWILLRFLKMFGVGTELGCFKYFFVILVISKFFLYGFSQRSLRILLWLSANSSSSLGIVKGCFWESPQRFLFKNHLPVDPNKDSMNLW